MKTWKLTVNEEELKALISWHNMAMMGHVTNDRYNAPDISPERSARIHDLTKRLNKETPDIETEDKQQAQTNPVANALAAAPPAASWG